MGLPNPIGKMQKPLANNHIEFPNFLNMQEFFDFSLKQNLLMNPRIILSQTYSPTLKFLLRSFFFFLLSNISSRHRRNYCNFIFLPKFGRCTYTILGQFYNQLKRSSVYNIYMDMSPLAVSLFQIHFQISNNQTITVFPALEVAPVQKQCIYQNQELKAMVK